MPTAVALVACACTALTVWPSPARSAVDPGLAARVAAAPADATFPVLVTLRRQVDGGDYEGRPQALLDALRSTAAASQPEVLEHVDGTARRFWLVNAVAVRATSAEIAALDADPGVERIDPDAPVRIDQTATPDLDVFPTAGKGDWGLTALGVPEVWRTTGLTGRGVRLGSIDTGVDATNPDLQGKIVAWRDFVGGSPTPYDDNGHGTHTIGTMVGGSHGGAPVGVAPDAQVVVAKAIGSSGVGPGSSLMAAAQWITDPDGDPATADQPVAVNNSWSADNPNDPWFRAIIRRWVELGITPVFASGNTGPGASTVGSPAGYPEVLAVGATEEEGGLASFTSRGPVTWRDLDGTGPVAGTVLVKPDLVAPGVNITSTVRDGYLAFSGTSMASPHVAGVIALMAQADPQARGQRAADILRDTAVDIGAPGRDHRTGAGRVDALAAVRSLVGPTMVASQPDAVFTGEGPVMTRRDAVTVRVALRGGDSIRWRVNGGPWSEPGPETAHRVTLTPGRNVVEAQAMLGEAADDTPARRTVVLDRTPPRVSFGYRSRGLAAVLVAKVTDRDSAPDPSSLRWLIDDGGRASGRRVDHEFATGGTRVVRLTARDRAGNMATAVRRIRVGVD